MKRFKLDNILLKKIELLINEKKDRLLQKKLNPFHYADIAEIIERLSLEQATYIIKLLNSETTSGALKEVDEDLREKIIDNLSIEEISKEIENLKTDDATDLILELPEEKQKKVLSQISDKNFVNDIKELLTYEEDSAGGIMAKELVKVHEDLSVLNCLTEMRKYAKNVKRVHSIYVVNNRNQLKGRLSLKNILTANSKAKIKDIYTPKADYVTVEQKKEEVAQIMQKYDLEAIPVVDFQKRLLGRITIDDMVDIIKEEADKDYQLAAGISNDVEVNDSILKLTQARLPWLVLGLLGGIGSVFILKGYEEIMQQPQLKSLFFYTPLIAAMAGNVGVQSSAIIVQGLANNLIKGSLLSKLIKEIGLSVINGIALGGLVIIFGLFIKQNFIFSLTIAFSMVSVIIIAALIGTLIPLILNKKGIDPAIATGPFITTANDVFGIFLFFYIAKTIIGT